MARETGRVLVATRALHLDQGGLLHTGTRHPLSRGWPPALLERPDSDGPAGSRRPIQRLNDPDVLESFLTRWLGLRIVQDAIGEVQPYSVRASRRSLAGSDSQDKNRSNGQQFTMRSAEMPASLACAIAVSA